jgi:hypothetical protein
MQINNPAHTSWTKPVKSFARLRKMNNLKDIECVIVEFMTHDSTKGYLNARGLQLAMNLQLERPFMYPTGVSSCPFARSAPKNTSFVTDSFQKKCLCYNAVTMQHEWRFANDNNNDNNDRRIVGRSLAG